MSIQKTIFLFIAILGLAISALTISSIYSVYQQHEKIVTAESYSNSIESLMQSAGHWAVERGVTNAALNAAKPTQKMLGIIQTRREKGNQHYLETISTLKSYEFPHKDRLITTLEAAFRTAQANRITADEQIKLPLSQRDKKFIASWVPSMSHLILSSQDIRYSITNIAADADPEITLQGMLNHYSWMMSEYAGRERAIIGAAISGKKAISPEKFETLSAYRGRVLSGWELVKSNAAFMPEEVQESIRVTEKDFFDRFEKTRKAVYKAGLDGTPYPITADEWIAQSTAGINTILDTQEATYHVMQAHIQELSHAEKITLASLFGLLIFFVGLLATMSHLLLNRVVKRLSILTTSMDEISHGRYDMSVPFADDPCEIGIMSRALETLRQSALEKNRLDEEQEQLRVIEKERTRRIDQKIEEFDLSISAFFKQLSANVEGMLDGSKNLQFVSKNGIENSQTLKLSSDTVFTNVSQIASATDEMSSSINEVSAQVSNSNNLMHLMDERMERAVEHSNKLSNASAEIIGVLEIIGEIAEKTNLLALNATIESARAGEAGKGFAVVANEVKNLAEQTHKSIANVEQVIDSMKTAAVDVAQSLESIKEASANVSEANVTISAAIEEQNATTDELSRNMNDVVNESHQISATIKNIATDSDKTGESSSHISMTAEDLQQASHSLKSQIDAFLHAVKTA